MHRHPLADHGDGRAALAHASYGTDPLCPRQPPDTVGVTHDGMRRMRTRTQAFNMGKAECRRANSNSVLQVRCIAAPWPSVALGLLRVESLLANRPNRCPAHIVG